MIIILINNKSNGWQLKKYMASMFPFIVRDKIYVMEIDLALLHRIFNLIVKIQVNIINNLIMI